MIHNASEPKFGWLVAFFMDVKEMLKFGYKLGQGLEALGCGSPTLIQLSNNKGRFGLGYELTHKELFQASKGKKRKCGALGMSIPHVKATVLALAKVIMLEPFNELKDEESNLVCIIHLCPKEFSVNAIKSSKDDPTFAIQLGMPS